MLIHVLKDRKKFEIKRGEMNNILKNLIFLEWLILNLVLHPSIVNAAFNCRLPDGCRMENVYNSYFSSFFNMKEFKSQNIENNINNSRNVDLKNNLRKIDEIRA